MILSASIILHALLYSGRHLLSVPVPLSYHSAQLRTTNSTIKSVNRRLRTFGFLVPLTHFAEPNPCPAYSSAKKPSPVLGRFLQTPFSSYRPFAKNPDPSLENFCKPQASGRRRSGQGRNQRAAPAAAALPPGLRPAPLFPQPLPSIKRRRASLFGQPCVFASWVIYLFIA